MEEVLRKRKQKTKKKAEEDDDDEYEAGEEHGVLSWLGIYREGRKVVLEGIGGLGKREWFGEGRCRSVIGGGDCRVVTGAWLVDRVGSRTRGVLVGCGTHGVRTDRRGPSEQLVGPAVVRVSLVGCFLFFSSECRVNVAFRGRYNSRVSERYRTERFFHFFFFLFYFILFLVSLHEAVRASS